MSPGRELIPLHELRRRLGVSMAWWSKHARRLERELGFPTAVPGFPQHYDTAALEAWLDLQMSPSLRAVAHSAPVASAGVGGAAGASGAKIDWDSILAARASIPADLLAGE